jgi:glycosyltransferase involved in cell wall biosynthesis
LASLFLYPSLRESFGIPLVEAMACGVPLITSNTSSMPEIAQDAALIIDPFKPETIATAIQELWQDANLQQSLVAKGIMRAKYFSWDANALLTEKIYKEVLEK